jgi:hypothetical protein
MNNESWPGSELCKNHYDVSNTVQNRTDHSGKPEKEFCSKNGVIHLKISFIMRYLEANPFNKENVLMYFKYHLNRGLCVCNGYPGVK